MSEERELLELAAKAGGYSHCEYVEHEYRGGRKVWGHYDHLLEICINPRSDDGDALRLAVKLKIDLRFQQDGDVYVDAGDCDAYTVYLIDTNGDLGSAARLSILRAAAEIGKAMQ